MADISNKADTYWIEKAARVELRGDLVLHKSARTRLNNEIAHLGENVFGGAKSQRSTLVRDQLKSAAKTLLKAENALAALPSDAWSFVGIEDSDEVISSLRNRGGKFREGANYANIYADQSGEAHGGPNRDKRLFAFVTALERIFADTYHDAPTHSRPSEFNDKEPSRFDRFVYAVYQALLPENEDPKWDTLNSTIRECLKVELDREVSDKMAKDPPVKQDTKKRRPKKKS